MDEAVDPDEDEQMKRNKALKVNMFTPVQRQERGSGSEKDQCVLRQAGRRGARQPEGRVLYHTELQDAGLTAADVVLTDDSGNEYRLPTKGELNLLLPMWTEEADRATVNKEKDGMYNPYWNDNPSVNTYHT